MDQASLSLPVQILEVHFLEFRKYTLQLKQRAPGLAHLRVGVRTAYPFLALFSSNQLKKR